LPRFSFVYNFLPRLKEVVKGKSGTRQKSGSKLPHSKSPQEDASGTRRSFVPQKRKSPIEVPDLVGTDSGD